MKKIVWKVLAIIFIVLFILENLLIIYTLNLAYDEEENTYDCYYNFCSDYPDSDFIDGICSCYDYDTFGNIILTDTKYYN